MKNITPSKLRLILSVLLFLLIAIGTGAFMFGYGKVNEYAVQVQDTASKALQSNDSLKDLAATKKTLALNATTVERAAKLASESKLYIYQDQIIKDINQFATEAGLSISNITFTDSTTASTTGAAAAPAATATPEASAAAPTIAPAGVKSVTATISLRNPIEYSKILTFLHLVEQSLFRMQVSQVGLSRAANSDKADQVTSDVLTIEVYVR